MASNWGLWSKLVGWSPHWTLDVACGNLLLRFPEAGSRRGSLSSFTQQASPQTKPDACVPVRDAAAAGQLSHKPQQTWMIARVVKVPSECSQKVLCPRPLTLYLKPPLPSQVRPSSPSSLSELITHPLAHVVTQFSRRAWRVINSSGRPGSQPVHQDRTCIPRFWSHFLGSCAGSDSYCR